MEEIKEESCSTKAKKCCTKGIVIVLICSLISFFLGYYFGSKSNGKIQRAASSGISRPFSPNIPRLPNNIPKPNINKIPNKPPKIQPPVIQRKNQPNIPPNLPRPQVNESQNKKKAESPTTAKPRTDQKVVKNKK